MPASPTESIVTLRIEIKYIEPLIWRRVEAKHGRDRPRLLEVERDGALVAVVEIESRRQIRLDSRAGDTIDSQDIGAEVAEQGSGERRGPDSAHLDDTKAIQRSRHGEMSWLKSENAISAMEPDGVIDAGPPDARGIGLDGAVLVAERNTEQQPVICGNAEMFTDDFGKLEIRLQ